MSSSGLFDEEGAVEGHRIADKSVLPAEKVFTDYGWHTFSHDIYSSSWTS